MMQHALVRVVTMLRVRAYMYTEAQAALTTATLIGFSVLLATVLLFAAMSITMVTPLTSMSAAATGFVLL